MSVSTLTIDPTVTDEELKLVSDSFEDADPKEVLKWSAETFGSTVAMATGFGAEGCALIDMIAKASPDLRIFYLDTDLLFPETYELKEKIEARYGIRLERRATNISLEEQTIKYGDRLWENQPDECCRIRKVEPLKRMIDGLDAWITAIRRDQSPARANAGIVERDKKFNIVKINPLATWSAKDVWNYIIKHDVPYNPLHDKGYPSIGCAPCTTPIKIGEDPRAGRWRGKTKTECGLHQ
jgi:phosphoadenosine phosphosulfate reductase